MKVQTALLIYFIFVGSFMGIYAKALGSTEIPINVERTGYCRLLYGEDYKSGWDENVCYNRFTLEEPIEFDYEDFREICPKNEFFSLKINSDCFHEGAKI